MFDAVANDTIVFVFGDHGMTATGDHGGETPLETDSALLIYSPLPIFNPTKVLSSLTYQYNLHESIIIGSYINFLCRYNYNDDCIVCVTLPLMQ